MCKKDIDRRLDHLHSKDVEKNIALFNHQLHQDRFKAWAFGGYTIMLGPEPGAR